MSWIAGWRWTKCMYHKSKHISYLRYVFEHTGYKATIDNEGLWGIDTTSVQWDKSSETQSIKWDSMLQI
ncbi:MAG: hypothetical protein WC623_22310 [Pedobacter sp.]|uniref:hypothetical protein n=1 Tax=Pedobacter sp. TaxID=1411316 RepID=UPI003568052D